MMGDTISVIVTIHDTKLYLPKCVSSILSQTYKNLEIILVDDGSTDGCAEMCERYARLDPRVKVVHQSSKGAAVARATGMRLATGKFIHFVDDDDWMDSNMEEEMMKAQERADADVVISGHFIERGGRRTGGWGRCAAGIYDRALIEKEIFPKMMCDNMNNRGIHPNLWMKLFRAETVRDAIYRVDPRILKANDVAACYEALYAANKINIIDNRYYHYRLGRPKSITTSFIGRYYESMNALLSHLLSSPMAERPEIARQIPKMVRGCISYGMQGGCGRGQSPEEQKLRADLMERLSKLDGKGGLMPRRALLQSYPPAKPMPGRARNSQLPVPPTKPANQRSASVVIS